ncbi:MAG: hypothetical protein ACAH09_04475 [Methylophilaceae bacterium]|jgi:hypothetical protein|nr:hypothetical protein [Methylophilaceae bacterium]
MKIRSVLSFIIAITISGCTTPYKPDLTGQPHANVRMVSNLHRIAWAAVLKESCIPQTTFGWESSTQMIGVVTAKNEPKRESIGMPLPTIPSDAAFIETTIPAGKPIALGFSTIGIFHSMACGTGLIFTPEDGADYQVTYQHKSGFDCSIDIQAIKRNEADILLQPIPEVMLASKC